MTGPKVFKSQPELCDGCRMCEIVCSINKAGLVNPSLARIKVDRSDKSGLPRPTICRHCRVAQCQKACPVPDAIRLDARTGVLVIDEAKCDRCQACVAACPFAAIRVGPKGEILKCDLCDGDPVCVKHCPYRPAQSLSRPPGSKQSCLQYVEREKR